MTDAVPPFAAPTGAVVRVRTDRRGVTRSYGAVLAGHVLLTSAITAFFVVPILLSPPDVLTARIIVTTMAAVLLIGRLLWPSVRDWWRMRRISDPIEMDEQVLVLRTPDGEVAVPWDGVESMTVVDAALRPRALRVVAWSDEVQSAWWRWGRRDEHSSGHWRKTSVEVPTAVLGVDPSLLAADVARLSGGRVEVRWGS